MYLFVKLWKRPRQCSFQVWPRLHLAHSDPEASAHLATACLSDACCKAPKEVREVWVTKTKHGLWWTSKNVHYFINYYNTK